MLYIILLFVSVVVMGATPSQMYRHAAAIERDSLDIAVGLYRQAADSGYAPAQNYLGFLYYQGRGVDRDIDSTLTLIERAASADYPQACNNLAWLLLNGDCIGHDRTKAMYWLQRAADLGHAPSAAQLADMLLAEAIPDTARVRNLAWIAARGNLLHGGEILWQIDSTRYDAMPADSLFRYANEYYYGGAPVPALKLLQRLPDDDRAVMLLADAASRGYGVPYNYQEALQLYLRAARLGNQKAQEIITETLEMFPDALPLDSIDV